MSTQTSACNGFFQEHANSALNQYFQQLNSNSATAAVTGMSSSNNSDSSANEGCGNSGSVTNSSLDGNRSSASSIDSTKSVNSNGNSSATAQWNSMQQQQQQAQHQNQQQNHQQQQQNHQQQQQQQSQHMHHAQQQQQQAQQQQQQQQQQPQQHTHHQHQQQQPHHQQQQQHPQSQHQHHQQQQQQQQHTHQQQQQHHHQQQHPHAVAHNQLSALSQTLSQNLAAAAAASNVSANTNPHSIFGSGNFHYKTNNSWTIPTLSCYQRLYSENQQHYHRQFAGSGGGNGGNGGSGGGGAGAGGNGADTQVIGSGGAGGGSNGLGSCNGGVSANAAAAATAASVQHVANAVAAAVMANEQHQSHLNSLKARFQTSGGNTGKSSSNSKEVICGDDKYKEEGDLWNVEAQTAFLGPNLWDKTLPYDADLKYADLDEFLSENNIPDGLPGTHLGHSSGLGHRSDSLGHAAGLGLGLGHITTKRERSPSPSDCISPETLNPPSPAESSFSFASSGRDFDPRTRAFSDEELKPQPMIKKSRKQFVPDELKDDKYWARRRKNNIAAKRSRDARRQKENQIAMRARYLEKENATLHQEVEQLKQENMDLRARLSKFQDV